MSIKLQFRYVFRAQIIACVIHTISVIWVIVVGFHDNVSWRVIGTNFEADVFGIVKALR